MERDAGVANGDALPDGRAQVHFDPPLGFVPTHHVLETIQVEISPEFTVDAREQILVERGRHAGGVIVRKNQPRNRFFEIGREQQCIAFAQD